MSSLSKKDISFDQSEKAEVVLDKILNDTSQEIQVKKVKEVSVEEEIRRAQILTEESERSRSRVLFISRDVHVLEKGSVQQNHFVDLAAVFDEIHVMVLGAHSQKKDEAERVFGNVWIYRISSKYFLKLPFSAIHFAQEQLSFTDGFRPDIIVGLDPFESAIAAYFIGKKHDRPIQIHILEDFLDETFIDKEKKNKWRLRFARFVLRRIESVRTDREVVKKWIEKKYKNVVDVLLLPRFFNIDKIIAESDHSNQADLFPQFAFTILFVGDLDQDSTLFRALDASRKLLQTSSIGLVVLGSGTAKEQFRERTKILGIEKQVIFKETDADLLQYMKSADVLLCTDTSSASEEVVVTAAAVQLPLVMARTALRDDLFTDEQDAYLCAPEDTIGFSQKLTKFVNTNALRLQFATNGREVVRTRIEEHPDMYPFIYRDTIEAVLYADRQKEEDLLKQKRQKRRKEQAAKMKREQAEKQALQDKLSTGGVEMKVPEV